MRGRRCNDFNVIPKESVNTTQVHGYEYLVQKKKTAKKKYIYIFVGKELRSRRQKLTDEKNIYFIYYLKKLKAIRAWDVEWNINEM